MYNSSKHYIKLDAEGRELPKKDLYDTKHKVWGIYGLTI